MAALDRPADVAYTEHHDAARAGQERLQADLQRWRAAFIRRHLRYVTAEEVVQKMVGCGDLAKGHALYLCPDCLERHVVAFSCKSQFCLSCATVYGQSWVETVAEMLHPGVTDRHLILTVPEALRTLL